MLWLIPLMTGCDSGNELIALQPNLVVTPEVLDFGEVVEEYSGDGQIQLINSGQGELKDIAISISGDGASAYTLGEVPVSIEGGGDASYDLGVTFNPKDPIVYPATLTIASNDKNSPTSVTLTGQGIVAPTPDIECDKLSLDYGLVAGGSAAQTLWTTCTNEGDDDLHITGMAQVGSGTFTVITDPTGFVLAPGEYVQIIVLYAPTTDAGDGGSITLTTDDPDEPETKIYLLGNGGGDDSAYPVAVVNGPSSAEPRQTITVEGGDSYDPYGYVLTDYAWTVTGPYDDVTWTTDDLGRNLYLQADLAGTYTVTLQVTNANGLVSAPAIYTVTAVPTELLHVELTWDSAPDLDLHLLTSSGELFLEPYDCNFCNVNPDWGVLLTGSDNPSLDLDARQNPPGKENINIDNPADDTYSIKVHYYEDNGGGDVTATVHVYLYGIEEATFSRVLGSNDVWDVAQIVWPDGYVLEQTTDLYAPDRRTCE
jgi:hypothetical protein